MVGTLALCLSAPILLSAEDVNVNVDGVRRHAIVFRPTVESGHSPVVFAFHGHGGTAKFAAMRFGIQRQWPEALVIYADGLPTKSIIDPTGGKNGWDTLAREENKDLKFFDKLYDLALTKFGGDRTRVFSMGHSNGALFSYTLWAMRGSKFAGFGAFEGIKPRGATLLPAKPLFITIGERDLIVPARRQHATLDEVLGLNGCSNHSTTYGDSAVLYHGVQPVVLWQYAGGHTFQPDAIPTMVKFFKSLS